MHGSLLKLETLCLHYLLINWRWLLNDLYLQRPKKKNKGNDQRREAERAGERQKPQDSKAVLRLLLLAIPFGPFRFGWHGRGRRWAGKRAGRKPRPFGRYFGCLTVAAIAGHSPVWLPFRVLTRLAAIAGHSPVWPPFRVFTHLAAVSGIRPRGQSFFRYSTLILLKSEASTFLLWSTSAFNTMGRCSVMYVSLTL